MHACTSLTAFPVFAVGRLRERNRINRLRSQSIMECYAVEVDFTLIYVAWKMQKSFIRYFILILLKMMVYCVTDVYKIL